MCQLHPIICQGKVIFKHKITQLIPDITIISRQDTDLEDEFIIYSSLSLAKIEIYEEWMVILMLQKKWNFLHMYIYNQNMMEQLVHMALLTKSNSGTSIKSKGRAHWRISLCICSCSCLYFYGTYAWKLWHSWCWWKYWW